MPLCVASRDGEWSRPAVSRAPAFDSCRPSVWIRILRRVLPAFAVSLESSTGLSLSVRDFKQCASDLFMCERELEYKSRTVI